MFSQNLNPDVLMMEAADSWYRGDSADFLRPSKIRSILIQREKGSDFLSYQEGQRETQVGRPAVRIRTACAPSGSIDC